MGLTSAIYTSLTGLNVNQARVETIGHNIANVNTTAFKGSRTLFQTQFSQLLSPGTAPSDESGGTNPMQLGRGAMVGTTQRTSMAGSLETTGIPSDLAINGTGYFIVRDANDREFYTRDGSFYRNPANDLVTIDGHKVRGFAVDDNFEIVPGVLQDINIPVGSQSVAKATQNVIMDGDLSAIESLAINSSETASQALVGSGGAATDATALTDLRSSTDPATPLFAAGDGIRVNGISKGGRDLPTAEFVIGTDGNTLGDFAAWLQDQLGIQQSANVPGTPGVTVENGMLVVRGNAGQPNAIEIDTEDIRSSNPGNPLPFRFTQSTLGTGTGVFTSFTVYDSLGTPVPVNATFVLEQTPNSGAVWRYYLESTANSGTSRALGTGTVSFDTQGNFLGAAGNEFTLNLDNSGATTPLVFTLDFSEVNGLSTKASNVIMAEQDGYPPGTLDNFAVQKDGIIVGTYSNGMTRNLGQVALAKFSNEQGLIAESDNLYTVGGNSGPATVLEPMTLGTGEIYSGALEMSNVDVTNEFIGLISSSTGFQAASRVISTTTDMLEQLMLSLR
jgi:flagellar hook protein FlgE